MSRLWDILTMARWLGPWASASARPGGVIREERHISLPDGETLVARVYRRRTGTPTGAWIIAPGCHFLGPDHPDLERFAHILAASSCVVMIAFPADYQALQIRPRTYAHFAAAFDAFLEDPWLPPGIKPAVWSISLGSLIALQLAGDPERADRVGAVLVFGGYGDFGEASLFVGAGEVGGVRVATPDPRSLPVLYLHMLDQLGFTDATRDALARGWRRFAEGTWGHEQSTEIDDLRPVAESLLADIPEDAQQIFLEGCAVVPGGAERIRRSKDELDWDYMEIRDKVAGLCCPVFLVHAVDDMVVHYSQQAALTRLLSAQVPVESFLTGLVGHSGEAAGPGLGQLGAAIQELRTMISMLRAVHRAARYPTTTSPAVVG